MHRTPKSCAKKLTRRMELGALIVEPWSFIRTSNGLGYSNFEAGRRREFFIHAKLTWRRCAEGKPFEPPELFLLLRVGSFIVAT